MPDPLYTGTIDSIGANIRDLRGVIVGKLIPGTKVWVYEVATIAGWHDRAIINPFTSNNVWATRIIRDTVSEVKPWIWPVKDVAHPLITQPFNNPVSYGRHEGIDLRIIDSPHRELVAVADCKVIEVHHWNGTIRHLEAYGNYVVMQWNKYQVWYCHMESIAVSVGQELRQGDLIGIGDHTGNSLTKDGLPAPHLHLQVIDPDAMAVYIFNQRCVDPMKFLPKP